MRLQNLSLVYALVGGCWLRIVAASCYYPDGTIPSDYIFSECGNGEGESTCCVQDDGVQCLSNGICYSPSSSYMYRGACTDKSWNDRNCFQHCRNTTDTWSAGSNDEIVSCGSDKYCCYSDGGSTCCNDDTKVFTVDAGTVIKTLSGTGTTALPIATAGTDTSATSKSASTSKIASGTSSRPSSESSSGSSSAANSTSSSSHASISKVVIIGIAIAGMLVLFFAIFLTYFFLRRRYRKKLAASNQTIPLSNTGFQKLQDKPELDSHPMPDKSPRPVEVPGVVHSPAPPYQPPYQPPPQPPYQPPAQYGVYGGQQAPVEIGSGYVGYERR